MSKTETEPKKDFKDNLDFVTLKIELARPFVDFIEDYRKFFGSKYTTEQICMQMIYDQVKYLYNELDVFLTKMQSGPRFVDSSDFFKKYQYIGLVSWKEPEDEETE
jgi:hypothetical protein